MLSFLLFSLLVIFRNVMQLFLTAGKVKGEVVAAAGTIMLYLSYIGALLLALWHLWFDRSISIFFITGFLVQWSGVAIRISALRKLGKYYSSFVEMRKEQPLVTGGFYALVRHPLHFAFLCEIAGMGIISENLLALIPFLISWLTIFLRNRREEKAMLEHFGEDYRYYTEHVPSMNIISGITRRLKERNPSVKHMFDEREKKW